MAPDLATLPTYCIITVLVHNLLYVQYNITLLIFV